MSSNTNQPQVWVKQRELLNLLLEQLTSLQEIRQYLTKVIGLIQQDLLFDSQVELDIVRPNKYIQMVIGQEEGSIKIQDLVEKVADEI